MTAEDTWWKESVVYQIYPRSFNDTDGDGSGDLPGITEKVDHLVDLGVDLVWLNPVYDSPLVDQGYDIRNYREIHDRYGSLEDWEDLRDALHERDVRLIMDLVVNHTSDEHRWFRRSRREEGEYADYYWWVDGDPDEPPNNWESMFGGPAWSYDDERGAWYLHLFDEKQPDLNWTNPAVREDVYDMMEWWLEKGIDGFRMDVINLLYKPPDLPDGDPSAGTTGEEHFATGEGVHDYVREMYDRVLAGRDIVTVGETLDVTIPHARRFIVEDGLDMVFSFDHVRVDEGNEGPWDVREWDLDDLREVTTRWQTGLGGAAWNSIYLGNHDQPRLVSRFGDDGEYRRESATMLATYMLTLRGTPFVYYGDELGMTNPTFRSLDEFRDEATTQRVERALESGEIESFDEIGEGVNYWSRDNARTPMQWSDADDAGFTDGEPWLKLNENYPEVNVDRERDDPDSVLNYYERLIRLRDEHDLLVYGRFDPVRKNHDDVLAYTRRPQRADARATDPAGAVADGDGERTGTGANERILAALNFFDGEPTFEFPERITYDDAELLLANYDVPGDEAPDAFDLRPYEARVYQLSTGG